MGYNIAATLMRPGFYPAGGGEILAEIRAPGEKRPLALREREALIERKGEAIVANLAYSIACRETARLRALLNWPQDSIQPMTERRAKGPGNILVATLRYEHMTEVCVAFGRLGASAETVAEECAAEGTTYVSGAHPINCCFPWRLARAAISSHASRRRICGRI